MNLMVEYTDEHYASKQEVADSLGKHLAEPIWNQLLEYRREYMVKTDSVEFCLCPGILKKTMRFYELLIQIEPKNENTMESLFGSADALWMFQHYLKTSGHLINRLHDISLMYGNEDEHSILELVNNTDVPNVVKIAGIIMLLQQNEKCGLVVGAMLNQFGLKKLCSVIQVEDLNQKYQKDGTYVLETLLLVWSRRMKIEIEQMKMKSVKSLNHLNFQYPQLKKYQIQFYINHHEPGYYYTIEQFIECSGVCYETGRCALKQMVDLGFYQMFKQGKKYVYTAR